MSQATQAPDRVRRRLAVILAADVAGYSRLVAADEEDTIRRLGAVTARFRDLVSRHDGRVFNTAGDAVLAEFTSAVDAVRCALDVQEATLTANVDQPPDRRIAFRIGIAVGDVIVGAGDDLLGDGVNIAARLEGLAAPGGICVSEEVRTHVQAKIDPGFTDLGLCALKNIPRPVRAFTLGPTETAEAAAPTRLRPALALAGAVGALALAGLAAWAALERNSPASPRRPFEAGQTPFVSDRTRVTLRDQFQAGPRHKALALSRDAYGVVVGAQTGQQAMLQAVEKCEARSGSGCQPFAADDEVVWSGPLPLPLPVDPRAEGPFPLDLKGLPLVSADEVSRATATFVTGRAPKALAVGDKGLLGWAFGNDSVAEAGRRALERCADRNGSACLLYGVGENATEPLPASHVATGYLDWSAIPAAERAAAQAVYRGAGWRALARGVDGRWFAAAGGATEAAAADTALASCAAAGAGCRLHAVGSFLVAPDR